MKRFNGCDKSLRDRSRSSVIKNDELHEYIETGVKYVPILAAVFKRYNLTARKRQCYINVFGCNLHNDIDSIISSLN